VKNDLSVVTVNRKNLKNFLGLAKRTESDVLKVDTVGVVTGLAWTSVGGQTLAVEVSAMEGTGKMELTGQLGDVMKESARAGFSLVRALANEYKIPADINEKVDIHIHLPEGAIPKDGPSAGVTMVTAMISALTGLAVRCDIAMTGEITLTGRVLKIGGLKEKSLAALRAGIRNIILPEGNRGDIEELPDNVRRKLTFYYVSNIRQVLDIALVKPVKKAKATGEEKTRKNAKTSLPPDADTLKN
jgi:ATP-dependent Lon protease